MLQWKELIDFFKKFSDLIVSLGSLIGICYYGIQLFRMQTKLAIPIIIICFSIILWIICFLISKRKFLYNLNAIAKVGVYVIPLVCLVTIIAWHIWPSKINIVVAKFECRSNDKCPGLGDIFNNLEKEIRKYKEDVAVIPINNIIKSYNEAEKYGRLYNAVIVIWGYDELSAEMAKVIVCYNILKTSKILKDIKYTEEPVVLRGSLKEAAHFKLSQEASKKMNNLVLFTIGLVKDESKEYDTAIECFTKSIEIAGSEGIFPQPEILFRRGNAFARSGRIDEAIKDYEEVIKQATKHLMVKALYNLGIMFATKNEYGKAIDSYTKALTIEKDFQIYNNRGVVYFYKNQFDLAINDFTEAIKINPKSPIIFSNRAESYFRKGKVNEALSDCKIAINLDENYEGAYINRAMIFNSLQKYREAISDCNKAIDLNDKYSEAYLLRGIAYFKIGDKKKSKDDFDKALCLAKNKKEKENILKEMQKINNE